ncbi:MAG: exo-alpha-sialidase [Planctomycetes bacterium]|nr:exo-alpha-sialidase [Planctomycetota bacterium]
MRSHPSTHTSLHLLVPVLLASFLAAQNPSRSMAPLPPGDLRMNPDLDEDPPGTGASFSPGTDTCLGAAWEPTIAVDPNDATVVAVAQGSSVFVSVDGGSTFGITLNAPLPAPGGPSPGFCSAGDPSLAFDSQGRLFLTYLGRRVNSGFNCTSCPSTTTSCNSGRDVFISGWQRVGNNFVLFVGPVNVSAAAGVGAPNVTDKEWIAADFHPGSSLYTDRLYVTWIDIDQEPWQVWTTYSTTSGATWTAAQLLSIAAEGNRVWPVHNTVAPNHDVYVGYHAQSGFLDGTGRNIPDGVSGGVVLHRSTNGGGSFTKTATDPFPASTADMTWNVQHLSNGVIPGATYWLIGSVQPWIMADPSIPGRLYVVCNDDPNDDVDSGDAADVVFTRSNDFGATWSAPVRIDDAPAGALTVLPTAAIDPTTGAIGVMWYDARGNTTGSGTDFLLNVRTRVSWDHGVSWLPSIVVNDNPFDPAVSTSCRFCCTAGQCAVGAPITRRIGEYNGIAFGGCTAHMTWAGGQTCGTGSTGTDILYDNDPELGGDLTAPMLVCPPNTQVGCNASTAPSATGTATATDDCDPTPTISHVDVIHPGNCPPSITLDTIERIWSAVDDAGNLATCSQFISRVDADAPVIHVPPPLVINGVTDGCVLATHPQVAAWAAQINAVEACTTAQLSFTIPPVLPADCAPGRTTQILVQAADACGNSDFALGTITGVSAPSAGTPFCFGDGSITPCPCGNVGLAGHGCDIAQTTGGVCLTAQNFAPNGSGGGTVDLVGMNFPTGTTPLVFALRANTLNQIANGVVFGDGLLCLGGTIQRITNTLAHDGKVLFPLNHASGTGRFDYQLWFRNLPQAFCDPLYGYNTSSALSLTW